MSEITLDQPAPNLGDVVTFTVDGVPNNVHNPRIEVLAYQDGDLVYGETASADQAKQEELTGLPGVQLGGAPGAGSVWAQTGGPADCVANLFYFGKEKGQQTYVLLASTTFAAGG